MKQFTSFVLLICALHIQGQESGPNISASSLFFNLKNGDSVTVYQCHVEEAVEQLTTASGQTITGASKKRSITEKFVIHFVAENYLVNYYTTSLSVFPNKKFSGLKIKERPYWDFQKQTGKNISELELRVFLALEKKGREAIEFDYGITKHNTNQIIIKRKKNFKQLVIEGNYVISKLTAIN